MVISYVVIEQCEHGAEINFFDNGDEAYELYRATLLCHMDDCFDCLSKEVTRKCKDCITRGKRNMKCHHYKFINQLYSKDTHRELYEDFRKNLNKKNDEECLIFESHLPCRNYEREYKLVFKKIKGKIRKIEADDIYGKIHYSKRKGGKLDTWTW
jgi:hypothetical protein